MSSESPQKRHLRLITNADLKQLIESREGSGFVTMLHPLELFVPRDFLSEVTRRSLEALKANRKTTETDDERKAFERGIQQRVDFLAWLTTQPPEIYTALYPADHDGLDELEDLQDLLEDDDRPLPF